MSDFKRIPIELETGIWAVTGQPILKEGEILGNKKAEELFYRREFLRRERSYDDNESHLFSHRGNLVYPDGLLETFIYYLKGIKPTNLFLTPENIDYNSLFSKLKSGTFDSGLSEILEGLGYMNENKEKIIDFIENNKERIQEEMTRNVFKENFASNLKGVNISNKFDIAYIIDSSVNVYISYNIDHINQATIVDNRIMPKQILGLIINESKIEEYQSQQHSIPADTFIELAHIHLATLRAFIDWLGIYDDNTINKKLNDFIQTITESFFYVDVRPEVGDIFTDEEVDFLNEKALVFWKKHFPFDEGTTLYDCLIRFCEKYNKPLYSSDNKILFSNKSF